MLLPWGVPSVSPTPATGQRPTFPLLFSRLLLCASCHNSPPLGSTAEACGEGYGFTTGETSTPGQAAWSKVTPSAPLRATWSDEAAETLAGVCVRKALLPENY